MHGHDPKGRLAGWTSRARPARSSMVGRLVHFEPFVPADHVNDLFATYSQDQNGATWRYLPAGPFADRDAYASYAAAAMTSDDPMFFTIFEQESGGAVGVASYLSITPAHGSIEVGHIAFSPRLQRSRAASEAMYLMARHVFDDPGYRRYEWKCDNANEASRSAAGRLGFVFEGVFRNHRVIKGRNRDTAWFSMTDQEWPGNRRALERWLSDGNFDDSGRQRQRLADIRTSDNLGD